MVTGVSPFDSGSVARFASGAALPVVGLNTRRTLVVLVGFEVLEAGLRLVPRADGPLFEYGSFANIVADVLMALIGYRALEALMRRNAWPRLLHMGSKSKP